VQDRRSGSRVGLRAVLGLAQAFETAGSEERGRVALRVDDDATRLLMGASTTASCARTRPSRPRCPARGGALAAHAVRERALLRGRRATGAAFVAYEKRLASAAFAGRPSPRRPLEPPVAKVQHAVGAGEHLRVVGHDDERAARHVRAQRVHHGVARRVVQERGRLVREHEVGVVRERAQESHALALAPREAVRALVEQRRDADPFGQRLDAGRWALSSTACTSAFSRTER